MLKQEFVLQPAVHDVGSIGSIVSIAGVRAANKLVSSPRLAGSVPSRRRLLTQTESFEDSNGGVRLRLDGTLRFR